MTLSREGFRPLVERGGADGAVERVSYGQGGLHVPVSHRNDFRLRQGEGRLESRARTRVHPVPGGLEMEQIGCVTWVMLTRPRRDDAASPERDPRRLA